MPDTPSLIKILRRKLFPISFGPQICIAIGPKAKAIIINDIRRFGMEQNELPMGFGMALARNPEAMQKFSVLSEEKKQEIIAGTHSVKSKEEMRQYVNRLVTDG